MRKQILSILFFIVAVGSLSAQNFTVAHVTTDEVPSPIVAGTSGQVVLAFSVTRSGVNTASDFNSLQIPTTTNPNDVFSSVQLFKNTAATGFGNATLVAAATATLNPTNITFANVTYHAYAAGSGSTDVPIFFYVVATVKPGVITTTAGAPKIQLSLDQTKVTFSALTPTAFSFTGTDYNFQGQETTISQTGISGLAGSPLTAGNNDQPIFGFRAVSTGSQSLSSIKIGMADPTGVLSSFRVIASATGAYPGVTGNIYTGTYNGGTNTIDFDLSGGTGPEAITTTPKFFFVVANVAVTADDTTPALTPSLDGTGITVNHTLIPFTTLTGTAYSFAALTATLTQIGAVSPSPLTAGIAGSTSQNGILGFTLSSNGTQTAALIKVGLDNDPAGKIGSYQLILSTDASFLTSGDNSIVPLTSSNVTGTGPYYVNLVPTTPISIGGGKNLFLVVSVNGNANSNPGSSQASGTITPSISTADITLAPVNVTANSFSGSAYSFAPSGLSTIDGNGGTSTAILHADYSTRTATSGLIWGGSPNSSRMGFFDILDGGVGLTDSDGQSTVVTSLEFTIEHPEDLQTLAIFDGTASSSSNIAEAVIPPSGVVTFTGLSLTAADGATFSFAIRATFKSTVIDENAHKVTITAATVSPSGSSLSATALNTADTGNGSNDIDVVSSELRFITLPVESNPGATFAAVVHATDASGNIDIGATDQVSIVETGPGPGNLTGGGNVSPVDGVYMFNGLIINLAGTYDLDADDAGSGQTLIHADGQILIKSLGVSISPFALSSCVVNTGNFFVPMPALTLTESDPADFSSGSNRTFTLILPTGWEFDTGVSPTINFTASNNITATSFAGFTGKTIARFNISISGTDDPDAFTISGASVKNVNASSSGFLRRSGTLLIEGVDEVTDLGDLTVATATDVFFGVEAQPNKPELADSLQSDFGVTSDYVILDGAAPVGTEVSGSATFFSGSGVSHKFIGDPINANRYTFNPSTLQVGQSYPITFTYTNPTTGCIATETRNFSVFQSAITGLENEYCVGDNAVQTLTVTGSFIPAGHTRTSYSMSFTPDYDAQRYSSGSSMINNGSSVTLNMPGHTFAVGEWTNVYIYGNFVGPDATIWGEVNGVYQVSGVSGDDVTYAISVSGTYNSFHSVYTAINPFIINVQNNFGTSLTVTTSENHGLQEGVKVWMQFDDLSIDGQYPYFYGWYNVINVTANTYDVVVSATGTWTRRSDNISSQVDIHRYLISDFYPSMAGTLNSRFENAKSYNIGFATRQTTCTPTYFYSCMESIRHSQPVTMNQLPSVSFVTLDPNYCVSQNTNVTLVGNMEGGSFSASPNVGLTDLNNDQANFLPSSVTSGSRELPILITYEYTDAKGCYNSASASTTVHDLPTITMPAALDYCKLGGTYAVTLGDPGDNTATGNSPFSYSWTPTTNLDKSDVPRPIATPVSNTNYTLQVIDKFGCQRSAGTIVNTFEPAIADPGTISGICANALLDLDELGASFTNPPASSASWSIFGIAPGQFQNDSHVVITAPYDFGTARYYKPSATDIAAKGFNLVLTTNDPTGPCPAGSASVLIPITANPTPPRVQPPAPLCVGAPSPDLVSIPSSTSDVKWYSDAGLTNVVGLSPVSPSGVNTSSDKVVTFYATEVDQVTGCESVNSNSVTIIVNPNPVAKFSAEKFCLGDFTQFTDESTLSYATAGQSGNINNWDWNFADTRQLKGAGPIPTSPDFTGTYQDPAHRFGALGNYDVRLVVTTDDGCSDEIFYSSISATLSPLRIGPVPVANFNFKKLCKGDATEFFGISGLPGSESPITWEWDFTDDGVADGSGQNPSFGFSTEGGQPVQLIVVTPLNCRDTTTHVVPILPYVTSFPYKQEFETDDHGWVPDAVAFTAAHRDLSSWQAAVPSVNGTSTGTRSFVTKVDSLNTYFSAERSVLYGPCINVANLDRPLLSFDYLNNTESGFDGVYLEIATPDVNGNLTWGAVGGINKGVEWYNRGLITGLTPVNGVGQTLRQVGWSDVNGTEWKNAKFSLDSVRNQTKVQIRFVFGSNAEGTVRLDGFALDNFKLSSRNRVMLVENFTNTTETANNNAFIDFKDDLVANEEVVKLQYHTALKGSDPINASNPADPNARAAFYGLTNTDLGIPRAYLDGYSDGSFILPAAWDDQYYSRRSLVDAPFTINIESIAGETDEIKGRVTFTPIDSVDASTLVLHIAIVEKSLSATNDFVVRKLLPSAAGELLSGFLSQNKKDFVWTINPGLVSVLNNLSVVAFIQDVNTKLVVQSRALWSPDNLPTVITGNEPEWYQRMQVYPNPADGAITVVFPGPAVERVHSKLIDSFGREVRSSMMQRGQSEFSFVTKDFAGGMYILQLETSNGVVRKKVMITHK